MGGGVKKRFCPLHYFRIVISVSQNHKVRGVLMKSRRVLLYLSFALVLFLFSCDGGCSSSTGNPNKETSTDDATEEVSLGGEESFTYEIDLPENATVSKNDIKITSFVADEAKILSNEKPSVVMAEDASGNTIFLGYALPTKLQKNILANNIGLKNSYSFSTSSVEVSIRSTALALVMMRMGGIEDATDKAALITKVLENTEFAALQELLLTEWEKDNTFLDKIMKYPNIVVKIKNIAETVYNSYASSIQTSNNILFSRITGVEDKFAYISPWNTYEPWIWYGTASKIKVVEPTFVAISNKSSVSSSKKYALGNPTNISYIADIYDESGNFLDWRFVGRNSTMLQKLRNSGAALTYLQTDLNFTFDPSKNYIIKIRKFWGSNWRELRYWGLTGVNLLHLSTAIANLVADGSIFELFANTLSTKAALLEVASEISSLASSINLADPISGSNISSIFETAGNIVASSAVNDIIKKHAKKAVNEKTKTFVAKIVAKFTAKVSNPYGWAVMALDAINDLGPFLASLSFAPSNLVYTVNFADKNIDNTEIITVPLYISLTSPVNAVSMQKTSTYFVWSGNGDEYDFYFGESSNNLTKHNTSTITDKQYQITNLTAGKTYYWKVIAKRGNESKESDVRQFTTASSLSDINVVLTSPANGVTNHDTSVTLKWHGNVETYDVYFGKNNGNLNKVLTDFSGKTCRIPCLDRGTTYYWKVIGKKDGKSVESAVRSFTTKNGSGGSVALLVNDVNNIDVVSNEFYKIMTEETSVDLIDGEQIKNDKVNLNEYKVIASFIYGGLSNISNLDDVVAKRIIDRVNDGATYISNSNASSEIISHFNSVISFGKLGGWYPSLKDGQFLTYINPNEPLLKGVKTTDIEPQSKSVSYWASEDFDFLVFRVDNSKSYTGRYGVTGWKVEPDRYLAKGFGTGWNVGTEVNTIREWKHGEGRFVIISQLQWTFKQSTKSGGYIGLAGRQILKNIANGLTP